ncbi:unnamed protein product [Cuscuta epithymum]|uniref:Uncharacterized protein n=1 Tax=Cuscuta epithymum TaxID=186058 RepID=A0AAV0DPM9_9ASTE|nr:unnamed protein product [Cuscuta epithymum]CAH9141169.1 unnamed protein product [Cuscuta epithymum]
MVAGRRLGKHFKTRWPEVAPVLIRKAAAGACNTIQNIKASPKIRRSFIQEKKAPTDSWCGCLYNRSGWREKDGLTETKSEETYSQKYQSPRRLKLLTQSSRYSFFFPFFTL